MMLLSKSDARFPAVFPARFRHARCWSGLALAAVLLGMTGARCGARDEAPVALAPSKWVKPQSFQRPAALSAADPLQDYRWLLSDRQINAPSDEQFVHQAFQALTESGARYVSRIVVNYDPACQTVTFHWARIRRGTKVLDCLDVSKFRPDPAGPDSGGFLFSSEKTAVLPMDDVRAGDIVDYAYTIEGSNPALDGKFAGVAQLQFLHPVAREVTRLLWPASRRVYFRNHLAGVQPAALNKSNRVEFTWDVTNVAGLHVEPPVPLWYDPFPSVQMSEFQKWSDVSRWAARIFTATNAPSPELARKINDWKKLPAPADQVMAAVRFVQEEIRNRGAQDGPPGYELAKPSAVFAARCGDSKDKALLLVSILRALKIDAVPVLVNDRLRRQVAEMQPSPTVFNHAIVQVNIAGELFWLDPSAVYQRGTLAARSWENYGCGLPAGPGATGLAVIPPCRVSPQTTVTEYLNVGGLKDESALRVVTVAEGADADLVREYRATTPREDIERDNLIAYAKFYPQIRRTAPMLYTDDEQRNRIETTESFAIRGIWSRLADEIYYHCQIHSPNVAAALVKPEALFRTMPLGVRHPIHEIFRAEVSINPSLPLSLKDVTVENPAFFFQRTTTVVNGKLIVGYEYRSSSDAVAPDALATYARDLDTATAALGYLLIALY